MVSCLTGDAALCGPFIPRGEPITDLLEDVDAKGRQSAGTAELANSGDDEDVIGDEPAVDEPSLLVSDFVSSSISDRTGRRICWYRLVDEDG